MSPTPQLFLIDGSALAYRSHFAFARSPLTTSKGRNVSAVFGFAQALFRLLDKENPTHWAVALDTKEPTFRHRRYAAYKATREKAPEELVEQFPAIRELVEAFRLPIIERPGYEADDLIASVAVRAAREGMNVFLVSGDKDFMQIVSPRIRLYNLTRTGSDVEIQGPDEVVARFGVSPSQIVDLLALMGDASDNIPGVEGIGEKGAATLLQEFGSLDRIYENLPKISRASLRQKLEAGREAALLSRELAVLDLEAARELPLEGLAWSGWDGPRLRQLFTQHEFTMYLSRLGGETEGEEEHDYAVIRDRRSYEQLLEDLHRADAIVIDTETTSIDPMRAELVGLSFSVRDRQARYLPVNLPEPIFGGDPPDCQRFLADLKPLLEDRDRPKIGQNIKYDMLVLSRYGVQVRGVSFDTMLASYCVSPGVMRHNLDHLALQYLGIKKIPTSALIGSGKKQITMAEVPIDKVGRYACEDADVTRRLVSLLRNEMRDLEVDRLFAEIEIPLIDVLFDMERTGVRIDADILEEMGREFDRRLQRLTEEIYAEAGEVFNLNSTQQLGAILFEKLRVHERAGIKRPRRTKTGYSTDADVLEALSSHPLAAKLLEYRQIQKLKSTYVEALPRLINPETGRIHTSFNQTVTATGRLSSSDPNLQNIPVRTELGRQIRRAFVPGDPQGVLLSADYSQIELRLLAHLSGDSRLIEAFHRGEDIHRSTAGLIFSVTADKVTPEMRARAKTINFGVIYGMGPQRLSHELGITFAEAQQFITGYFEVFSGVKDYLEGTVARARSNGYVTTLLGRRRRIEEIDSSDPRVRANMRNIAVNTPVQGTAADMIKIAMIRTHRRLAETRLESRMIIQVHDELVFDVVPGETERVRQIVKECMEGALELDVPVVVGLGEGKNWLEAH
ncbi:MAG: DNA polymerase I [Planctomycetota bacterium]